MGRRAAPRYPSASLPPSAPCRRGRLLLPAAAAGFCSLPPRRCSAQRCNAPPLRAAQRAAGPCSPPPPRYAAARRRVRIPARHERRGREGRGSVRRAAQEERRGEEGPRGGRRKRREWREEETGEGGRWMRKTGRADRRETEHSARHPRPTVSTIKSSDRIESNEI